MRPNEIIDMIAEEEDGQKKYRDLAHEYRHNPLVSALFQKMAEDEASHMEILNAIFEAL